jgi:hypothetical protein
MTTLTISLLALAVAFYGIFERQRAVYSAMPVRITELLSEAEALNVQEDRYREEQSASEDGAASTGFALTSMGARRALLTYQALALLHRPTRLRYGLFGDLRLTPTELGSLAQCLMRCGDPGAAREQWEAAVTSPEVTTDRVRAANCVGLAQCLFELGEIQAARHHYGLAVDLYLDAATETGRHLAFNTCVDDWLRRERGIDDGEPALPVRVAQKIAEAGALPWQYMALSYLRRAATRTICDPETGNYSEEISGFDDSEFAAHA